MKLILFDIDGTLLYTGGSGRIAFEKAFEELFGVQDAWQDLIPDGKTDPMIIEEIVSRSLRRPLGPEELEVLAVRYHQHFEFEIQNPPKFKVLSGVRELLSALSLREDVLLGIATGNFEQAAWAKLRKGEIDHFFRFGGFASDHGSRVELTRIGIERGRKMISADCQQPEIFLIGDTPHDVHVGKSLSVPTIAVATGRTSVQEFQEKYQPEYALEDLSDVSHFLDIINSHRKAHT